MAWNALYNVSWICTADDNVMGDGDWISEVYREYAELVVPPGKHKSINQ